MFRLLKKTIAVCMIGFGLGMLFVLLLPLCRLAIYNWCYNCYFRSSLAFIINNSSHPIARSMKGVFYIMTIVVKKVPKFLRGFVKFIFGIKD